MAVKGIKSYLLNGLRHMKKNKKPSPEEEKIIDKCPHGMLANEAYIKVLWIEKADEWSSRVFKLKTFF